MKTNFAIVSYTKACFVILITLILVSQACVSDEVEPPAPCLHIMTYDNGIREIIRNNCNLSGCHDGSSGVGNYNSYNGLQGVLSSGAFRQEVVISRTMPRNGDLTTEEFEALKCWSENDYPEN